MSKKISIILLVLFVLGIILAGFLMVKNKNQPSSIEDIQEAGLAVPADSGGGGGGGPGNLPGKSR